LSQCGGWPESWQALADNIFYYDHWNPEDFNVVVKWRTLAPTVEARRNLFVVASSANSTGNLELFHDHSSTQKRQWDGATWDENLYFRDGSHDGTTGGSFGNTWPKFGNLSSWRDQGKDVNSLLVPNPSNKFLVLCNLTGRIDWHSP
jgi:hypothetical protein